MSHDDKQQRYQDILKRIAEQKTNKLNQTENVSKSAYDLTLDSLNAYDEMAKLPLKTYKHILCYGPQVIRQAIWSGVVVWYRNKGYYGYQTLHLLGVWAYQHDTDINLIIGIRDLPYRAPIHNPEGYHASIRNGFKIFYDDNGHPPDQTENILFQSPYNQKERLTFRQTLNKILNQWFAKIESD